MIDDANFGYIRFITGFFRENDFTGLIGQDSDYAIFGPPRYFSAKKLKLTFRFVHPLVMSWAGNCWVDMAVQRNTVDQDTLGVVKLTNSAVFTGGP